jgi:hypothetical protein
MIVVCVLISEFPFYPFVFVLVSMLHNTPGVPVALPDNRIVEFRRVGPGKPGEMAHVIEMI